MPNVISDPRPNGRHPNYRRYATRFEKETLTRQSEAGETDVNAIIKKHRKTGVITHLNHKPAMYGDLSQAEDLKTALDLTFAAQEGFDALPSAVRKAANNDPRQFLAMLASEDGTQALAEAGLEGFEDRIEAPVQMPMEKPAEGKSGAVETAAGAGGQEAPDGAQDS